MIWDTISLPRNAPIEVQNKMVDILNSIEQAFSHYGQVATKCIYNADKKKIEIKMTIEEYK